MRITDTLDSIVRSPVTWASAILTSLAGVLGFIDPVWTFVGSTASYWFPAIAVSATNIAPVVPWLDQGTANQVLLLAAFVYVAYLVDKLAERAATYWSDR